MTGADHIGLRFFIESIAGLTVILHIDEYYNYIFYTVYNVLTKDSFFGIVKYPNMCYNRQTNVTSGRMNGTVVRSF